MTYKITDAMAAISARKIKTDDNKKIPYPIFLFIASSTEIPLTIQKDVASNIDAIIFENEKIKGAWEKVKNLNLIKHEEIISLPASSPKHQNPTKKNNSEKQILGFVGPLSKGEKLKKLIDGVNNIAQESRPKIIVAGTGKARYIMPIVKIARANRLDIEWLGEREDLENMYSQLDCFFVSGDSFTEDEKRLLADGVYAINEENIKTRGCSGTDKTAYQEEARILFRQHFSPEKFLKNLECLITTVSRETHN